MKRWLLAGLLIVTLSLTVIQEACSNSSFGFGSNSCSNFLTPSDPKVPLSKVYYYKWNQLNHDGIREVYSNLIHRKGQKVSRNVVDFIKEFKTEIEVLIAERPELKKDFDDPKALMRLVQIAVDLRTGDEYYFYNGPKKRASIPVFKKNSH